MRRSPIAWTLAMAAFAAGAAGAAAAQEPACRVREQTGAVQLLRAAGPELATVGAALAATEAVRTGSAGKVLLDCQGGLQIAVGPASEVRLDRYLAEGGGRLEAALDMAFGIVRLLTGAPRPGRSIEVETRAAVASVRSTEWLVEATPRGTGVLAIEGRVEVTGAGVTVALDPGFGTDVAPGRPPEPPHLWGDARRSAAIARTMLGGR
jgi:hypothetical protein